MKKKYINPQSKIVNIVVSRHLLGASTLSPDNSNPTVVVSNEEHHTGFSSRRSSDIWGDDEE